MDKIRKFRTDFLVRCLLRQIYQMYDAGGISSGRSRSAILLESAMGLFRDYDFDPDRLKSDAILAELKRRKTDQEKLIPVAYARPMRLWKDLSVAFLLLVRLTVRIEDLYTRQSKNPGSERDDEHYVNVTERDILKTVLGSFSNPDPANLPNLSVEVLTEESHRRWAIKMKKENNRRLNN